MRVNCFVMAHAGSADGATVSFERTIFRLAPAGALPPLGTPVTLPPAVLVVLVTVEPSEGDTYAFSFAIRDEDQTIVVPPSRGALFTDVRSTDGRPVRLSFAAPVRNFALPRRGDYTWVLSCNDAPIAEYEFYFV